MKPRRRAALRTLVRRGAGAWLAAQGGWSRLLLAAPAGAASAGTAAAGCMAPMLSGCTGPALAQGLVWQLDNAHVDPVGRWDALGVTDLLVQWSAVDGIAFVSGPDGRAPQGFVAAPRLPDWRRIAAMPWAQHVLMGLSGLSSEPRARADMATLAAQSQALAALIQRQTAGGAALPLSIEGWYFPVEADPTWQQAPQLRTVLAPLPRPLWISIYDRSNIGGAALARWLASWLPDDVGVLFQDGVGVYARDAQVARQYVDALAGRFGSARVRVIAEAFRPLPAVPAPAAPGPAADFKSAALSAGAAAGPAAASPAFRAATADELRPQLRAYQGYRVYLFDGPHYVSNQLVERLLQ